jgi:Uma2 family endonuclease
MATLTIQLPRQRDQNRFNLRRWAQLTADTELARFDGRVETDRHGHILMSPPPAPSHGSFQLEIGYQLRRLMPAGRTLTECPISTADGVKAADVAWASAERMAAVGNRACFLEAPEICVEVLSPANTEAEMREKMALYFDAGAREVWLCAPGGRMSFFTAAGSQSAKNSRLCPAFPKKIMLK